MRVLAPAHEAHWFQMLRKADAHKDRFLATLSHELRKPLAPICNDLRIMKLLGADDERLQPTLEMRSARPDIWSGSSTT